MSQETVSATLRVPKSIRLAVEKAARTERRSINAFVLKAIEQRLRSVHRAKRKQPA